MRIVRRTVSQALRRLGWQRVAGGPIWRSPSEVAAMLRRYGLEGRHIVDVGAHRGDYARALLQVFPRAFVTMFEPQPELHGAMADLVSSDRVALIGKGVGASTGTFEFTRHDRADSQSFAIDPSEALRMGWTREVMEVVSLDDHIRNCSWPSPDIIKIDAEGWDLEVLRGAAETLRQAELVFMEASVARPSSPHLPAVLKAIEDAGFRFLGLTDVLLSKDQFPWYVEAAMVRVGGVVDARIPRIL